MKKNIIDFLEENYEQTSPILIGVIGVKGKTSIVYFLSKYLEMIGKKVSFISSLGINRYDSIFSTIINDDMLKIELKKIMKDNPEFIIVELHEERLFSGVAKDLLFDYLFIPRIGNDFNLPGKWLRSCFNEILSNNDKHTKIITDSFFATDDRWISWIKEMVGEDNIINYSFLPSSAAEYNIYNRPIPKYIPVSMVNTFDKFIIELEYNKSIGRFLFNIPPFFSMINIMGIVAFLCENKLFSLKEFELFSKIITPIPGRGEFYSFNNRYILIDLGSEDNLCYYHMFRTQKDKCKDNELVLIKNFFDNTDDFFLEPTRKIILHSINAQFDRNTPTLSDSETEEIVREEYININSSGCDFLVLTQSNYGNFNINLANEILLNNVNVPFSFNPDRRSAIKDTLGILAENEVLLLSCRANRRNNINEKFVNDPFADIDIVNEWFEENL